MKLKQITIWIIFGLLGIIVIMNSVFAEDLGKNLFVDIKYPFYPIENLDTEIEFYIWNYGNSTFNGSLIYWISGEKINWNETRFNITVYPKKPTLFTTPIKSTAPGLYWTHVKLEDKNLEPIYTTQSPFNVHSLEGTATIGILILGLFSFIAHLIHKK